MSLRVMSFNRQVAILERELNEYIENVLPREKKWGLMVRQAELLEPLFNGQEMSQEAVQESLQIYNTMLKASNSPKFN